MLPKRQGPTASPTQHTREPPSRTDGQVDTFAGHDRLESRLTAAIRSLLVPSLVSVTVHVLLLVSLASVTWTIAVSGGVAPEPGPVALDPALTSPREDSEPDVEQEDPAQARSEPASSRAAPPSTPPSPPKLATLDSDTGEVSGALRGDLPGPIISPDALSPVPPAATEALDGLADVRSAPITFAGIDAQRARSVVFVVDGSGAMSSSLPLVIDELKRTIERLDRQVRFQVVVFRDRSGIDRHAATPTMVLPPSRSGPGLRPASPINKAAAFQWLDRIEPSGRSNPLAGLERAFSFGQRPELVMLLARSIPRTEDAEWGVGKQQILQRLDALNPLIVGSARRRAERASRATTIHAVQFLDDDPTGIMQAIAMKHGGGLDAYAIRTASDLLTEHQRPDTRLELGDRIDQALGVLGSLTPDAADLAALFGIPADDQRARVADAARRVAQALAPVADQEDPMVQVLIDRARLLEAAAAGETFEPPADRSSLSSDALGNDPIAWQREAYSLIAHAALVPEPPDLVERAIRRAIEHAPEDAHLASILELELAAIHAAATQRAARQAAGRAIALVDRLSGSSGRDPRLALVVADALATRARRDASPDEPETQREVFDPYLRFLDDRTLSLDDRRRRGVALDRIARHAQPWMALDAMPPVIAYAEALAIRERDTDDPRAVSLLRSAAERAGDDPIARDSLIMLADHDRVRDPPSAARAYLRIATAWPDVPGAAAAIGHALLLARDHWQAHPSSDAAMDLYERVLRDALADPNLDHRRYWLDQREQLWIARARTAPLQRATALIERIDPASPNAADAVRLLDARLASASEPGSQTLGRIAEIYARHGSSRELRVRLDLASSLIDTDPESAWEMVRPMLSNQPDSHGIAEQDAALIGARALIAIDRPRQAFELLAPVLASYTRPRTDPPGADDRFWTLWALGLETRASISDGADREIRAHLARLRTIDPALGGDPHAARLQAVTRSLGR